MFTVECIVRIVACGLIVPPGAYLRSRTNVMDFIIVLMRLVSLFLPFFPKDGDRFNVKWLKLDVDIKALLAFRFLRPLRFLSNIPSLQTVINAIFRSLRPLAHIALLVVLMLTIYAIIGM